ncbi:hypothetical protein B0H15DRAFT_955015 [Mycena belliarum]|uniref:Uncharacterized protein n=1 Tax=Mycena belliarum TaxID=1033014 RepID=A0AAD6XIS3_9AGAR|nr:hypothetical protein B0H15DRAFT_955015 [Mycena belliae]
MPPKSKAAPTSAACHWAYCRCQQQLFEELNGAAPAPKSSTPALFHVAKRRRRTQDYGNVYTFCPTKPPAVASVQRLPPTNSILASRARDDARLLARLEAVRKKRDIKAAQDVHCLQSTASQAGPSSSSAGK